MERTTKQKIIQESVWNEVYDNVRDELTNNWFFNLGRVACVCRSSTLGDSGQDEGEDN